jgi:hypothetical protein
VLPPLHNKPLDNLWSITAGNPMRVLPPVRKEPKIVISPRVETVVVGPHTIWWPH